MSTGLTCVGYGWTVLSFLAAFCVAAGFYLPFWLIGELKFEKRYLTAYFGSFRRFSSNDYAYQKVPLIGKFCMSQQSSGFSFLQTSPEQPNLTNNFLKKNGYKVEITT